MPAVGHNPAEASGCRRGTVATTAIEELYRREVARRSARERRELVRLIEADLPAPRKRHAHASAPEPETRRQADEWLLSFAGCWTSGDPNGSDNRGIDTDLAAQYGRGLDPMR